MSEPKFTPGPWSADDDDGSYFGIFDENGAALAFLVEIAGGGFTRLLPQHNGPEADYPHWPTHAANARLIAAAPELYAALANLVDEIETDGGVDTSAWPLLDDAKAALMKARGGS